jgi:hypothetical protein
VKDSSLIRSLCFTAFVLFMLNLPDRRSENGSTDQQQGFYPTNVSPVERRGDPPSGGQKWPRVEGVHNSEKWLSDGDQRTTKNPTK